MEETLRLLEVIDAVHGQSAVEAANRLREAMVMISMIEAENLLHPENRKERYTMVSTLR